MNIRKTVPLVAIVAVSGVSPALADCCSSVFDCAAAVVTDGLSCEIETIISTIKTLATLTANIYNDITGQTQSAQASARQSVAEAINSRMLQSQLGMADLLQAKSKAELLYQQESSIQDAQATTVDNLSGLQTTTQGASSSSSPNSRYATSNHSQTQQAGQAVAPSNSLRANSVVAQNNTVNAQNKAQGNSLQKTSVAPGAGGAVSVDSLKGGHGQYKEAFARGLKQITALSSTANNEADQINQHLVDAQASEGPGVAAANTLAASMLSPLNSIQSQLSSMLSNPLSAFDPSSQVDSIEDAIKANLSANISQMIDDITTGPNQACSAADPIYDELLANAESAQAIANAMDRLYRERTQGAANALDALLPKGQLVSRTANASSSRPPSAFGQRLNSAKLKTAFSASRQKILASVRPLNLAPLHAALAQFKAQRAQGKSAQAPSMLAMYRTNTTHQLDSFFAGKTPAAMASERDQLIAQARTRFPNDPKTQNGVISLISQEAQKLGAAHATAVGMTTTSQAPPKTNAWSAPPAWTPPAAASAPIQGAPASTSAARAAQAIPGRIKPASALKPSSATANPAPSSLTPSTHQ